MEVDLVASVPTISERDHIMQYVWDRCESAWAEDNMEEAQEFHRMYVALEAMTDDDVSGVTAECLQ